MRPFAAAALLSLLGFPPLVAQTPTKATDSSSVLVFDHLFETGVLEHIPVFLQKGVRYRAVLDHPGVQLQLYTPPGVEPPFLTLVAQDVDAEARLVYEIYPSHDGDVEFRVIDGEAGAATRLQVWHDPAPVKPRSTAGAHVPLEFGLEVNGGVRFGQHSDMPGFASDPPGSVASGCLATRNSPRIFPRFGGAAVCFEHRPDPVLGAQSMIFIEPRFRLLGDPDRHDSHMEVGFFIRIGARWSVPTDYQTPDHSESIFFTGDESRYSTVGLYAAWDFGRGPRGGGWALLSHLTPEAVVTLGVGRYF